MAMTATMDPRQVIDPASHGRKCVVFALRGEPRRQGATVEYPGSKEDRNGIESRSIERDDPFAEVSVSVSGN
jgi:hypothetical protein